MSQPLPVSPEKLDRNPTAPSPIQLAREYVQAHVQRPALASELSDEVKSKIKHSDFWLEKFTRVGDLLIYLQRFEVNQDDPIYKEMKKFNLLTFEDIVGEFSRKFAQWSSDCTRISDFIIGHSYTVFDILILARNYDTRSGGMFVLEVDDSPTAVVIKATLSNGRYANEWLDKPNILKYYLKSISGVFGEHFKTNKAIISNPGIPIVTFTRDNNIGVFIFRGVFRYEKVLREIDGSKAFILSKNSPSPFNVLADSSYVLATLDTLVAKSMSDPRALRLERLSKAKKLPTKYTVTSMAYDRNPDVVAEVLYRASGLCESCLQPAPFLRVSTGTPYLEVHHRIQLSKGGEDTLENAIALCPNCHRRHHHGPQASKIRGATSNNLMEAIENPIASIDIDG